MAGPRNELDLAYEGHARRNVELLARLREQGVDLAAPRDVELHYWVEDGAAAERLGREVAAAVGGEATVRHAQGEEDGAQWSLDVRARVAPQRICDPPFVRDMVRRAFDAGGEYDGWGTWH